MLSGERPLTYSLIASGAVAAAQYETCGFNIYREDNHQATWAKDTQLEAPGRFMIIHSKHMSMKTLRKKNYTTWALYLLFCRGDKTHDEQTGRKCRMHNMNEYTDFFTENMGI
jgi:hypothetical protein